MNPRGPQCTVLYCTVLTETLLRPLVRGQDEVVVEAELGAAVQPGAGPWLLLSVSNDFIT